MDRIICYCHGIKESAIIAAIRAGARSLRELQAATGAGNGRQCTELNPQGRCCSADIEAMLARVSANPLPPGRDCCSRG